MFRTVFVVMCTVPTIILSCIIIIITSPFSKKGDFPHKVNCLLGKLITTYAGLSIKVTGRFNIDEKKGPYIYMANHQSNFDIPILLTALPLQYRWLIKAELFKLPLFGRTLNLIGYIRVERTNMKAAFLSLKQGVKMLKEVKRSLFIFPEGTRSLDGDIQEFKGGGAVLAMRSKVPIVPVVIHGSRSIMPKNSKKIISSKVVVEIKKPVYIDELGIKNKNELMSVIKDIICKSFDKRKREFSNA